MTDNTGPALLRLADYRRPPFTTSHVDLSFDIHEGHSFATSRVTYRRTAEGAGAAGLVLDAEAPSDDLKQDFIQSVTVDGWPLAEGTGYFYNEKTGKLHIPLDPGTDTLDVEIKTYLEPQNNTALSGLYASDGSFLTQCESEGFRRITPFLDRPDVMATYTVRLEAPENVCPTLLSNGNHVESGALPGGRHYAVFDDPFAKPSYLFACVGGKLDVIEDVYITKSGRPVNVRVYTDVGHKEKGRHALQALKDSMKWDEDVFDCEYDLDDFNIVATSKFNAGAMENKGLNVFRDVLVLANPDIATDANYQSIIDVVGHEYFHNYSGNRITLANWFNLSLKEGLTVNREQMFTAFTTTDATQRIEAVAELRARQFPEDDGPLSHPVMPAETGSVDNLYTSTIYEKGSEVIRMMKVLMGEEKFIEGVKHYFSTYDGQAVTIDEFVKSMEHVSGRDFSGAFKSWYTEAGRPQVRAQGVYDPAAKTYTLTLEQTLHSGAKNAGKKAPAFVIPIKLGLVDFQGVPLPLELQGEDPQGAAFGAAERVLTLSEKKQSFVFQNVQRQPAFHSLLRGFSAPVDLDPGLSESQLYAQMQNDPDGFNRWDAGQKIALREMKRIHDYFVQTGVLADVSERYLNALEQVIDDDATDPMLRSLFLTPPGIKELEKEVGIASPAAIKAVRDHIRQSIGRSLYDSFSDLYRDVNDGKPYNFDHVSAGRRALKGIAVQSMAENGGLQNLERAKTLYFAADNLTDRMAAMGALKNHPGAEREAVFGDFYSRFKDDKLTIQKWFSLQAATDSDLTIGRLRQITADPVFDIRNPGHVAAVYRNFAANYGQFHRKDGAGYDFLADAVIAVDKINPYTASGLVGPLCSWRQYNYAHQRLMIAALEKVRGTEGLSANVLDKITRSLPDGQERVRLGLQGPNP